MGARPRLVVQWLIEDEGSYFRIRLDPSTASTNRTYLTAGIDGTRTLLWEYAEGDGQVGCRSARRHRAAEALRSISRGVVALCRAVDHRRPWLSLIHI